jgi:hypothetical protein
VPIVSDQQDGPWNIPVVNRLLDDGIEHGEPVGWDRALRLGGSERRSAGQKQRDRQEDPWLPSRLRVWTDTNILTLHNPRKSLNKL